MVSHQPRRYRPGRTTIEVRAEDIPRIDALAAELTAIGPGKFTRPQVIRYLLDTRQGMETLLNGIREDPE